MILSSIKHILSDNIIFQIIEKLIHIITLILSEFFVGLLFIDCFLMFSRIFLKICHTHVNFTYTMLLCSVIVLLWEAIVQVACKQTSSSKQRLISPASRQAVCQQIDARGLTRDYTLSFTRRRLHHLLPILNPPLGSLLFYRLGKVVISISAQNFVKNNDLQDLYSNDLS